MKVVTVILGFGLGFSIALGFEEAEPPKSYMVEEIDRLEVEVKSLQEDMAFVMRMPVCTCK